MSTIERLARMLYERADAATNGLLGAWELASEGARNIYRDDARAVLGVLKEPATDAMLDAATESITGDGKPDPDYRDDMQRAWMAMVAALEKPHK